VYQNTAVLRVKLDRVGALLRCLSLQKPEGSINGRNGAGYGWRHRR
jgi:hypothetical protein